MTSAWLRVLNLEMDLELELELSRDRYILNKATVELRNP